MSTQQIVAIIEGVTRTIEATVGDHTAESVNAVGHFERHLSKCVLTHTAPVVFERRNGDWLPLSMTRGLPNGAIAHLVGWNENAA